MKVKKGCPSPRGGEKQDEFISRCMSADHGKNYKKDQKLAVCFSTFREAKKDELIKEINKLKKVRKEKLINNLDILGKQLTSAEGEGEALIPKGAGCPKKNKKKKLEKQKETLEEIKDEEKIKQVTVWNEHGHTYDINDKGDGKTSTEAGHSHKIKGYQVLETEGHMHYIPEVQAGLEIELSKQKDKPKDALQRALGNIKKDLNYYDTPKIEYTTRTNGHRHQFWIDQNGDGKTSADLGHNHIINQFVLDPTQGHTHWLPELQMGIKEELEHSDDLRIATKIAIDHLREDNHYYTKLREAMAIHG